MTGGVVVLGSVNRDLVAEVAALPAAGETVTARRVRSNIGGKGANQAVAARLLGASVTLVARVGDDSESELVRAGLARAGLDVGAVRALAGQRCGTAYITVAGGANTIVVDPGANHVWPGGLGADLPTIAAAAVLVLQQEIPAEVNELAARTTAARVILNAAPSRPVSGELLARCDPLVVNALELADQAGEADPNRVRAAMTRLLHQGARSVVTTLGPDGAAWATAGGSGLAPAVPVEVVDSTGAGDAFVGALAAELAAGAALPEAVRWAAAAGSASVRAAGTQGSYPDREAVRELFSGR